MKAVVATGGKCVLTSRPIPTATGKNVLLRVKWTAVNRADTLQGKGLHNPPPGATDVLGLEAAGEVVAVGPECERRDLPVGTRVMALLSGGGYAEFVPVPESHVMVLPKTMDYRTAAAIPETWLTAYQLLFMLGE